MLLTIAGKLLLRAARVENEATSTVSLAEQLSVSQQSVSRVIADLVSQGLVERRHLGQGMRLGLTAQGRSALVRVAQEFSEALDERSPVRITGTVETGLGEGKYYLSLSQYKERLRQLLGAEPFPGTLNLRTTEEQKLRFLARLPCFTIPGFETRTRSYGPIQFYPVTVEGQPCGIVQPLRTSHGPGLMELVAPFEFRVAFTLADGEELSVEARR